MQHMIKKMRREISRRLEIIMKMMRFLERWALWTAALLVRLRSFTVLFVLFAVVLVWFR